MSETTKDDLWNLLVQADSGSKDGKIIPAEVNAFMKTLSPEVAGKLGTQLTFLGLKGDLTEKIVGDRLNEPVEMNIRNPKTNESGLLVGLMRGIEGGEFAVRVAIIPGDEITKQDASKDGKTTYGEALGLINNLQEVIQENPGEIKPPSTASASLIKQQFVSMS